MTHEIAIRCEHVSRDRRTVRIVFERDGRPWLRTFFRSSGPPLRPGGDALLCLGLLPAVELGCRLRIDGPVDRGLLAASGRVQRLVAGWAPGCRPVEVRADVTDTTYPAGRGHGLFFSCGVDSAYSLAVNRGLVDGLVTIVGADVSLDDRDRAAWLAGLARRVAAARGVEATIIETDLPAVMHPYLGWIEYHGSVLAAIRHLLADRFATMRVASSADAETEWDAPWGSHPGIDPLLVTAGAVTMLDGAVTRPLKIARLVEEPDLLASLRVCYHGGPNCGTCCKCVMTRLCLAVLAGGRPVPSFPPGVPPIDRAALAVDDTSVRNDRLSLRDAAAAAGGHDDLVAALDAAVADFDHLSSVQ
ncbi:MAG: hypothetical protein ACKOZU_05025, partial [Planctomycetaceae bacterium]